MPGNESVGADGDSAHTHDTPWAHQPGSAPECMMCPICMFLYTARNMKPEVMEHVMKAGMELVAAFKALTDQYAERWSQAEKLERIPIL